MALKFSIIEWTGLSLALSVILAACGKTDASTPSLSPTKSPGIVTKSESPDTKAKLKATPLESAVKRMKAIHESKTENKVKSFAFVTPSADWEPTGSEQGDGNYTKAGFKHKSENVQLTITSIGTPATGKEAAKLVGECETSFAQGSAKHPEMTREWIAQGFSISRYADPGTGSVSVWCVSNSCRVQLGFLFPSGSKPTDTVKVADATVNAFFEKNPSGGSILK